MKLELKHLAPYLSYGLKGIYNRAYNPETCSIIGVVFTKNPNDTRVRIKKDRVGYSESVFIGSIKPILHPLSDLTKEIEHNGEKFVPIIRLLELKYSKHVNEHDVSSADRETKTSQYPSLCRAWFRFTAPKDIIVHIDAILQEPYNIMQKLFEWKIDVFNLIPSGLAISYNDIKTKQA